MVRLVRQACRAGASSAKTERLGRVCLQQQQPATLLCTPPTEQCTPAPLCRAVPCHCAIAQRKGALFFTIQCLAVFLEPAVQCKQCRVCCTLATRVHQTLQGQLRTVQGPAGGRRACKIINSIFLLSVQLMHTTLKINFS